MTNSVLNIYFLLKCVYVYECRCKQRPEVLDSTGMRVTNGCEPSGIDDENQTPVCFNRNVCV